METLVRYRTCFDTDRLTQDPVLKASQGLDLTESPPPSSSSTGLSLAVSCLVIFVLFLTTTQLYRDHSFTISFLLALLVCTLSLLATANVKSSLISVQHDYHVHDKSLENDISPAGLYAVYLAVVLLLYSAVPLPLYATFLVGVTYSCVFEVILCHALPERSMRTRDLVVNVLLHGCIHVVGVHTLMTNQVTGASYDVERELRFHNKLYLHLKWCYLITRYE